MANNDYHFVTDWHVAGTIEEVSAILEDAEGLARWWPSVYLDVQIVEKGEPGGVGKVVRLYTKGWLPYTLRWQFRVTESNSPFGFALEAWGDFVGRGVWTLTQNGPTADIVYDWKVEADKPLLRFFSFLLRPLFAANHRWAMAQGEISLNRELLRRRAASPEEASRVPSPPGPTFPHNLRRR